MPRLEWDEPGERLYETGVRNGVLYPLSSSNEYDKGYVWNGLSSVTENPSGAEASAIYADDMKYLTLYSAEELGLTIEAYMYPDQFGECDGSKPFAKGAVIGQQKRKSFGLCYRTILGNDSEEDDYGYKLHCVYGCKVSPTEKAYSSVNDNPEPSTFSWEATTTPVKVAGMKPTSSVTIDSTKTDDVALKQLEAILYGVDAPEFSSTATYVVGDYVTHESDVYVCKTAVTTPGQWDSSKWDIVNNPGPRLPLPAEILSILGDPVVGA